MTNASLREALAATPRIRPGPPCPIEVAKDSLTTEQATELDAYLENRRIESSRLALALTKWTPLGGRRISTQAIRKHRRDGCACAIAAADIAAESARAN